MCQQQGITVPQPHTRAVLLDRLISNCVEPLCIQPTFLVDLPAALCPLAKNQQPDSSLSARFELFILGREYW